MTDLQNAFNAMLASDAAAIAGGEFGEPITYRPKGDQANDVTVNATVFRQQVMPLLGVTGVAAPSLQIFVTRADVPNPVKGDQFVLATNVGGEAVAHPFTRRLKEDAGGFLLELR